VRKAEECDSGTVNCSESKTVEERRVCVDEGTREVGGSVGHRTRTKRAVPDDVDA
jgi:hypothetical protein